MGDFSRDPKGVFQEAVANGYSRIRFQQGKPLLDRELNLLADLASPQRFAQNNFGNGIRGEGNDFLITNLNVPGNDFSITAGSCLVDGEEVVLAAATTYQNQPRKENVSALPAGTSNVYLRVFRVETSGAGDAALLNAVDVRSETSLREQVAWEVLVTTQLIITPDHLLLASINTAPPTITDRRRKGLKVSAIRDELTNARGSAAQLGARLDVSHNAAGALLPNTVGNAQIIDNTIGQTKLANGAVIESKIGNTAVSTRTIADGAVTIEKMKAAQVVRQQVTLAAAPANGRTEQVVNLLETDGHAFFLVSVHVDEPRPRGQVQSSRSVDWKYRVLLNKVNFPLQGFRHTHQVVVEHTNDVEVKATVRALRLSES